MGVDYCLGGLRALSGLERGEADLACLVVPDYELHCCIAEIADAIEKQHGTGWIVHSLTCVEVGEPGLVLRRQLAGQREWRLVD